MSLETTLQAILKNAMKTVARLEKTDYFQHAAHATRSSLVLEVKFSAPHHSLQDMARWELHPSGLKASTITWPEGSLDLRYLQARSTKTQKMYGPFGFRVSAQSGFAWMAQDLQRTVFIKDQHAPLPLFRDHLEHLKTLKALGQCLKPWPFQTPFWDLPRVKNATTHQRLEWQQWHPDMPALLEACNAYNLLPMRFAKTSHGVIVFVEQDRHSQERVSYHPLLLLP